MPSITSLAPYIALIAGIIVAFLTFKSQLRLKSYELLLKRREEVLSDIEKEIEKLQTINLELKGETSPTFERYGSDYFQNGLILYHKMKGANFGETAGYLIETYYHINNEKIGVESISTDDLKSWIFRKTNVLSSLYGLAHSKVNMEIQYLTLPGYKRLYQNGKSLFEKWKNRRNND
ncbi:MULTISPECIES: hypothetical protein [Bacilli]|uniref:hypothetical protein n=1 Tax=Bacilli TaxID=91061 RepID=UPI00203C2EB2|nr:MULTISPECIES: hypothetical protein [Bacilli]MCM3032945.1 hypothetical protein [Niallia sp. MER 6]MDK8746849.1 hypothetical protein [Streptococcus agalactiae]